MTKHRPTQPEWSMRIGSVKGAIWKNAVNDKPFYTVSLTRSYQDADGNWLESSSFSLTEALAAQKILEHAADRLVELTG